MKMETRIPVFTCGYCGSTIVKKGDKRCACCGGNLDWENPMPDFIAELETAFITWAEHEKRQIGKNKTAKEIEVERKAVFEEKKKAISSNIRDRPKARDSFFVPTLPRFPGKDIENNLPLPCNDLDDETKKRREEARQRFEEKRKNIYKIARIIIIGVSRPFDMRRRPDALAKFPPCKMPFIARLYWIYREDKTPAVHVSCVWMREEKDIEKYTRLLFKVIDTDVDNHEAKNGKMIYNVARHGIRIVDDLSIEEIEKITGTLPNNLAFKKETAMIDIDDALRWRFVTGTCSSKIKFESGIVLEVITDDAGIDEKPLHVHVGNFINVNDVNEGDMIIVTGESWMRKNFKDATKPSEPSLAATAIRVVESKKINIVELEIAMN